jgi:hypothetical protein
MNDALEHDDHPVLARMREQIAATPMLPAPRRLPSSLLGGHRRMLAGVGAGVGAISATLVLIFAGVSSPPAFAVTTTADGTMTITLNALSAVDSLNAKLAAAGLHVRVAQVVPGCDAPVQTAGSDAPPATLQAEPRAVGDSVQFSPAAAPGTSAPHPTNVPSGQTLVLAASKSGLQAVGQINQSTAPACVRPASGQ